MALQTAGTLGAVVQEDLSKDPLAANYPAFPVAIVGMPDISSEYLDTSMNRRTYEFPILVLAKYEETTAPTDIEDLVDALIDKFDQNFTLGGLADGGVEAAATKGAPISSSDKTYVAIIVIIKARATYTVN